MAFFPFKDVLCGRETAPNEGRPPFVIGTARMWCSSRKARSFVHFAREPSGHCIRREPHPRCLVCPSPFPGFPSPKPGDHDGTAGPPDAGTPSTSIKNLAFGFDFVTDHEIGSPVSEPNEPAQTGSGTDTATQVEGSDSVFLEEETRKSKSF